MYYKYINPDRQKFDAALFLIENMKYHKGIGCITKISTGLKYWRMETDSIYASIRFSDMDMNDQRDSLNNIRKKRIAEMSNIIIPQIDIDSTPFDDIKTISFHFLKEQLIMHLYHGKSPFSLKILVLMILKNIYYHIVPLRILVF